MLTGKCLKEFEKWFKNTSESNYNLVEWFEALDFNMQYGVYVDFFDSAGIIVDPQPVLEYDNIKYTKVINWLCHVTELNAPEDWDMNTYKTRQEAQTQALLKANELFNLKDYKDE